MFSSIDLLLPFAARTPCRQMLNLLSTRMLKSFSSKLLSSQLLPACTGAWGCSISNVGLCIFFSWTLWGFWPTSFFSLSRSLNSSLARQRIDCSPKLWASVFPVWCLLFLIGTSCKPELPFSSWVQKGWCISSTAEPCCKLRKLLKGKSTQCWFRKIQQWKTDNILK